MERCPSNCKVQLTLLPLLKIIKLIKYGLLDSSLFQTNNSLRNSPMCCCIASIPMTYSHFISHWCFRLFLVLAFCVANMLYFNFSFVRLFVRLFSRLIFVRSFVRSFSCWVVRSVVRLHIRSCRLPACLSSLLPIFEPYFIFAFFAYLLFLLFLYTPRPVQPPSLTLGAYFF